MLSGGFLIFGDLLQLYASLFIWNQIFIAVRAANVSNKIFLISHRKRFQLFSFLLLSY